MTAPIRPFPPLLPSPGGENRSSRHHRQHRPCTSQAATTPAFAAAAISSSAAMTRWCCGLPRPWRRLQPRGQKQRAVAALAPPAVRAGPKAPFGATACTRSSHATFCARLRCATRPAAPAASTPNAPCRNFVCGWLAADSPSPDDFRPDRIGIILVPTRWRDTAAWILLPAGRDAAPEVLDWMQNFAQASGQAFYCTDSGQRLGYGSALFPQDMLAKLKRGEKLW